MEDKDLQLLEESKQYVNSTGKWMMFFAILMGLSIGFMVLIGTVFMVFPSDALSMYVKIAIGVLYSVLGLLWLIPTIILVRASKAAKNAVCYHDNEQMVEFLRNTKSFWKFWGIFTISMFGFYLLMVVAMVIFMLISGF